MNIEQERQKLQKLVDEINKILGNVVIFLHDQQQGAGEKNISIRHTNQRGSLWVVPSNNGYDVVPSGQDWQDYMHKFLRKLCKVDGRRVDGRLRWQINDFEIVKKVIYEYAGVKKENMPIEIEFYPEDEQEFKNKIDESNKLFWVAYNNEDIFYHYITNTQGFTSPLRTYLKTCQISSTQVRNIPEVTKLRAFASNDFLQEKGKFYEKVIFADKFYFEEIKPLWKDFLTFEIDNIGGFIEEIKKAWSTLKGSYKSIQLQAYFEDEDKSSIIQLLNKIIAIIDKNAAKKKELNPYDDKRVIASSNVKQDAWIYGLLNYKDNKTPSSSINNAISYIENPNNNMSIFSKEHRALISKNILKATYNKESFVSGLKQYFNENEVYIKTECQENQTLLMTKLLYHRLKDKWKDSADTPTIDVEDDTEYSSNQPLNQILYGPPGTGKTYSTVNYALDILDATDEQKQSINSIGKLKEEFGSQVEFVTFHQSFSYEDFVEGLKANTDGEKLTYDVEDGVFKEICKNATNKEYEVSNLSIDANTTVWKISLYGAGDSPLKRSCFNNNEIRIGWPTVLDLESDAYNNLGANNKKTLKYFQNEINEQDIVVSLHNNKSIDGVAVVTGDYERDADANSEYPRKRTVKWLWHDIKKPIDITKLNNGIILSERSVYELYRVNATDLIQFLIDQRLLPLDINKKSDANKKPHVLIIDEINRGNISRIFGELITLIEPSKRAGAEEEISVKLPYSKEDFSVPNNLHIIGTMNTADRSLTLIDTALRRRFDFVEMLPNPELPEISTNCEGVDLQAVLKIINQRIEVLYDREHTIGHSFLMNVDSLEELQNTFKNKILPLLEEYFYDDWQKIKTVLADNNDSFYKQTEQNDNLFTGMEVDYNQEQKIYNRQNCGELEVQDFIQIYQSETNTNQD